MRSSLGTPPLVRLLHIPRGVTVEPAATDFAERMSLWFNAFDAIRLQAAHQAVRTVAPRPARSTVSSAAPTALTPQQDLHRVRSVLAKAIAQDPPRVAAGEAEAARGYAPFQQRHAELQRQMALLIPPLREHVRQVASRASPRLRQLALLDAALQDMLAEREQALLPTAAGLLQRRFEVLRSAQDSASENAEHAHETAHARSDSAWLDAFRAEWRAALLAELDLRLGPVAGLVAALRNESELES